MEIDFKYLDKLLLDANNKRKQFKYYEINEKNVEIVYLRRPSSSSFEIYKYGLMGDFCKQKNNLKEQSKLRSGSKNYLKIYNINNRQIRIDSFVAGRVDVVFLVNYMEDKRYLFPFSFDGGYYPTYTYITRYTNGIVSEEYLVNSNQIVYEKYEKTNKNEMDYLRINYIPNGKCKILDYEKGIFSCNFPITYEQIEQKTWLDNIK
jgi:hypothetical protein